MEEKKLKVMIVEDEKMLLDAIVRKLASLNFETLSCTSAEQALDYLNNMEGLPDVIWLDFYLPDKNGIEFMNDLKANPAWASIPVIVVSNSADDEKRKSMLALGAKKYILKAKYRLDDIADMVSEIIVDVQSTGENKPS